MQERYQGGNREEAIIQNDSMNEHQKIEIMQKEFLYRHELYWRLLFNFLLIYIGIFLLPFASEIFGIKLDINIYKEIKGYIPLFASFVSQIMMIIIASEAKRVDWVNKVYTGLKNKQELFFDATKMRPEPKVTNYTRYLIFIVLNFMALSAYFYLKSTPENTTARVLIAVGVNIPIIMYFVDSLAKRMLTLVRHKV